MKVLVTGALGTVGEHVLSALDARGHCVRAFDRPTRRNLRTAKRISRNVEFQWGDIGDPGDVRMAVSGVDRAVHLAAVIPPLADREPDLAYRVNVEGTMNLVDALATTNPRVPLVYTSSIAVYGDRLRDPYIRPGDRPSPNRTDGYANQKLCAEDLIRRSVLKWCILRLTYVVSEERLRFDPLMFEMPTGTSIEICHARDAAKAISSAVASGDVWGKTLLIAGGERCRTTFGEYVNTILRLFGFGAEPLPRYAFSASGYHCGYMRTDESERLLSYQRTTLEDFYESVRKRAAFRRLLISPFNGIARRVLLMKSKHYRERIRGLGALHASR